MAKWADCIAGLGEVLPAHATVFDDQILAPRLCDSNARYHGKAGVLLLPENTLQVQQIMQICHRFGVPVVPQGGNTSRCGGATPMGDEVILLAMDKMNKIEHIDPKANTMSVQAGCILASVQAKAQDHDRLFALSLGAEGSCQIGGNIATNAGGVNVLRYGNMREQVSGLEVVLADGQIWDGMRMLHKDNHGYDMKQMFIGSEGTLGVIARACLKLHNRPAQLISAMVGVQDPAMAIGLFGDLQQMLGPVFSAFELIPKRAFDWLKTHFPDVRQPFDNPPEFAVLMRVIAHDHKIDLQDMLQDALHDLWQRELLLDAVIAQSQTQEQDFWKIRETMVTVQKFEGLSIKHDVAVPVGRVAQFLEEAQRAVLEIYPRARIYPFGHIGDGNIHYNISRGRDDTDDMIAGKRQALHVCIHDLAMAMDGTFSAEHGVGRSKRDEWLRYVPKVERDMMVAMKRTLDPKGILNPDVLLSV